jgi:hypothetical protein
VSDEDLQIKAVVCGARGCRTLLHKGDEWCGHINTGREVVFVPLAPAGEATAGAQLIAAERERQVTEEGWTPEHDDTHQLGELVDAAVCYARCPLGAGWRGPNYSPEFWPWDPSWWKPASDLDNLVKAGALIAAEIDRLRRLAGGA